VPAVARVRRVELTAGFDKAGPSGDLFTKNHRITRVRLTREGKPELSVSELRVLGDTGGAPEKPEHSCSLCGGEL